MKVNPISNSQQSQSFGMAVKIEPKALEYIKSNLNVKEAKNFAKLVKMQTNNNTDIHLTLADRRYKMVFENIKIYDTIDKNILTAKVNNKSFFVNDTFTIFKNPIIKLMEKATKYANKQNQVSSCIDSAL